MSRYILRRVLGMREIVNHCRHCSLLLPVRGQEPVDGKHGRRVAEMQQGRCLKVSHGGEWAVNER